MDQISGLGIARKDILRGMTLCKMMYHQEKGKAYQHFVVSNNSNLQDVKVAHSIGVEVAGYYTDEYQVAVYTHADTKNLHSHVIVNTVNMKTGKKLNQNKEVLQRVIKHANGVLIKYGQPVIGGVDIFYNKNFVPDCAEDDYDSQDFLEDIYYGEAETFQERGCMETDYMVLRMVSNIVEKGFGVIRPFHYTNCDEEQKEIIAFLNRMCERNEVKK